MQSDSQLPSDTQRRALCELTYRALVDIRALSWEGKSEQAADLADAFHNLPVMIWQNDCSLRFFRDSFVAVYQRKYAGHSSNYLARIDEIIAMKGQAS